MKYKTLWTLQAEAFLKSLAPELRHDFRLALKKLSEGNTAGLDLRALEGALQGYMRLRVRTYRIIYQVEIVDNAACLILVAAGPRSTIYDAFEKALASQQR